MNITHITRRAARLGTLALLLAVAGPSLAAPNVSIVVDGQVSPGVYGRVQIGQLPSPPLLYPQPVVIVQPSRPLPRAPIYLHVPPGHAMHWDQHCRRYGACGQPVYFVKSREYERGYQRGYEHGHHDDDRGDRGKKYKHKHRDQRGGKHGGRGRDN